MVDECRLPDRVLPDQQHERLCLRYDEVALRQPLGQHDLDVCVGHGGREEIGEAVVFLERKEGSDHGTKATVQ